MSLLMLGCYKNISPDQANLVLEAGESVNSMSPENIEALDFDKWYTLFLSGDESELAEEYKKLAPIYEEIRQSVNIIC